MNGLKQKERISRRSVQRRQEAVSILPAPLLLAMVPIVSECCRRKDGAKRVAEPEAPR